jgi:hypothetical protein
MLQYNIKRSMKNQNLFKTCKKQAGKTVYKMKNTFETVTIEDDSTIELLIFIQLNSKFYA